MDLDSLSMQEFYEFHLRVGNYPIHEAVIRFAIMKEKEDENGNTRTDAVSPTTVGPERGGGTG